MDIRRIVLWGIFLFSLLIIWTNWNQYKLPPQVRAQMEQAAKQDSTQANNTTAPSSPPVNTVSHVDSQKIHIKNEVFDVVVDTQGAQLVQATLLDPRKDVPKKSDPFVLLENGEHTYTVQSGLLQQGPNQYTMYHLAGNTANGSDITVNSDEFPVVFEAESNGVRLTRTYTFSKHNYAIKVSDQITNLSNASVTPSHYLQITRDNHEPPGGTVFYKTASNFAMYSDQGRFQKFSYGDIDKGQADVTSPVHDGWIGFIQHFFVTAWVPEQNHDRTVEIRKINGQNLYALTSIEKLGTIAPQQTVTTSSTLWVGPQNQQALAAINPNLSLVVDYGWATILAKPMFKFMTWLHSFIGNWGWTIVVLTLIVKLILFPLTAAGHKSMAKMKNVAPRMKAIKEKYADDKQGMNAAMMEMYRSEKINPVGGCLPLVIQIPIFISLYRVISASVELRGAPWIGWIHDLSVSDPYYILPAIMLITMFIQVKLTPKPPDPTQAKVMMFMPFIFSITMFIFPAGLVLYWTVNSILSVAQQQWIMRRLNRETNESILTHK